MTANIDPEVSQEVVVVATVHEEAITKKEVDLTTTEAIMAPEKITMIPHRQTKSKTQIKCII